MLAQLREGLHLLRAERLRGQRPVEAVLKCNLECAVVLLIAELGVHLARCGVLSDPEECTPCFLEVRRALGEARKFPDAALDVATSRTRHSWVGFEGPKCRFCGRTGRFPDPPFLGGNQLIKTLGERPS